MTKAQGYNTHTLLAREAVPGTSPGGNFLNFAVLSNSLGKTSENVTDQLAGQGRDMTETYPDVNAVNGDMRMPVCLRAFGHILTGIFGNAVTTENAGVFTHTFKSGALALPSYAIETAHKGPGLFNLALGVMMNTLTMPFATGGGRAEATVGLIGRTETPYAATQGGVPTELTAARVSKFSGTIKKGGVALGDVTSATLTYNNNLSGELELNSGADIAQIDVGSTLLTLAASTRFSNKALFDEAAARTPADIELELLGRFIRLGVGDQPLPEFFDHFVLNKCPARRFGAVSGFKRYADMSTRIESRKMLRHAAAIIKAPIALFEIVRQGCLRCTPCSPFCSPFCSTKWGQAGKGKNNTL